MQRLSTAMTANGPSLDLDGFLPYLINVLAGRVSRELAAVYEERFGISIAEWRVIAHLARNREVSVREIRRRVDMDKSKVSRAAARLEQAGIIEKKANASDRRLVRLSLTRKGRRMFENIAPLAVAYESELLSGLPAEDLAAFRRVLDRLLARTAATAPTEEADS
ncbi:MarR family transcriptional regulator [Azospirillum sp. SYSU D00513]|uniref:MarR family winged helix-turn-helix transcriptional regulator n=1 Tax=Azospirillum sp. SYSU D00513 TaxID=2812561 RepID=UPI001A968FFE|nr:MarR family transcriptional regulator [Azospirillum sp. SYSU D00513]